MEAYLRDIEATRAFLKRNFDGPEVVKALRFRLQTHLEDPMLDPLSRQVWPAYLRLPEILEEPFSVLDAGCMSGFLYHHLKRYFSDFTYTGLDRWPEALEVGREFAPEVEFVLCDFLEVPVPGSYDYVVCSNIPWSGNEQIERAAGHLLPAAKRGLIFIFSNAEILTVPATAGARVT